MPDGWTNLSGHGTYTIPIMFYPNSSGGSFSGSFTATYTNSQNYSQPLHGTVNYSGENMVPTATASPKYQVLSILYIAPGNASSSGFSTSQSQGTTRSVSSNFSELGSISFTAGFLGAQNTVTFGSGVDQGNSSSYTVTTQSSTGAELKSVQQKMDHTQDTFYLLVDPDFQFTQTASSNVDYGIGHSVDATGSFPNGKVPPDIIPSNVRGFQNPLNGNLPLSYLEPQVVYPNTTLPGIESICANPLPPSECTTENACGCTAADFATVVSQDELAGVTSDTVLPSTVDPNRFVHVTFEPLDGPEQSGTGPATSTYTVSDSSMSNESTSNGTSYSVGYTHKFSTGGTGTFDFGVKSTETFTYSQTQTAGNLNGQYHSGTVTLGTGDVGCHEYVDVYEDTTYHTFAYALPQSAPSNCQ